MKEMPDRDLNLKPMLGLAGFIDLASKNRF